MKGVLLDGIFLSPGLKGVRARVSKLQNSQAVQNVSCARLSLP
jgi:hypothetical protein